MNEYREHHDWAYARGVVWARDKGVCQLCGMDIDWLDDVIRGLRIADPEFWFTRWRDLYLAVLGVYPSREPWECDHVEAKADGGPDHPDNLRCLCIACHKDRTRIQARERARARRAAKRKDRP